MDRNKWASDLFRSIDAKDTARFMNFLDPDAQFRYGSSPPAVGAEAIRKMVDGVFASVAALSHELHHVWDHGSHLVVEGTVTYTRHDGRKVPIPFCNVFGMRDDRVKDYLVYTDPAPLFAA